MLFTILGSTGFIGKHLVNYLKDQGFQIQTPDIRFDDITKMNLGNIIYAIGESKQKGNIENFTQSHIGYLNKILDISNFDSFLYCSATRVYSKSKITNEDTSLFTNSIDPENLYTNLKILGESICLSYNNPKIRIARLSNVTGNNFNSNLFLPSIIRDAVNKKNIELLTTLKSEKDYILIDDVVQLLTKISLEGRSQIYNVASGINLSNKEIVSKIQKITKCELSFSTNTFDYSFPKIDITKIINEFNFKPQPVLEYLEYLINCYQNK
jgi:nucleoside-diphosphate-sugar epimerase